MLFVLSFFQGAVARLCEELVEGVAEAIVSFIFIYFLLEAIVSCCLIIGSLSKHDGDGSENVI